MKPLFAQLDPASTGAPELLRAGFDWDVCFAIALLSLLVLPALAGLSYLGYYVFSQPLRRREQTRLFLDLIETGLESRQGVEPTVMAAARAGGKRLSRPFRQLADRLGEGLKFGQALELTPALLPASIAAMLRAGAEVGDLRKTIQGCRRLMRDAATPILKAQHYLMLLAFVTSPMWIAVFVMLTVFVMPKLEQIHYDMAAEPMAGLLTFLIGWRHGLVALQAAVFLGMWLAVVLYWGGPRLTGWLTRQLPLPWSWIALRIPWERHRLMRDFAALLGLGLDAGLPEPRAVLLAADGSANELLRRRAVNVIRDLQEGLKLPRALRHMDAGGELAWRLENAARGGGAFGVALSGWEEALDARAFFEEQTAAQFMTTGLVLLNGLMVGLLTAGVFQMFTRLITGATLW